MSVIINGDTGITTPAETVQGALTTTGNNILGDATTDTLNVGAGGLVKDASGNVGIGTATPVSKLNIVDASATVNVRLESGSVIGQYFASSAGGGVFLDTASSHPLVFRTNSTEQARIDTAGLFKFNSGYGSVATAYGCRAWVNFNGTGTVAIRGSGNVSSITDNGTGDYTVNFTTAMPDANYTAVTGVGALNTTTEFQSQCNVNGPYSTTSVRLATGYIASTSEAQQDKSVIQIAIFR
jgi:hypothetical protein